MPPCDYNSTLWCVQGRQVPQIAAQPTYTLILLMQSMWWCTVPYQRDHVIQIMLLLKVGDRVLYRDLSYSNFGLYHVNSKF